MRIPQAVKDTRLYEWLRNAEVKRRWPGERAVWERRGRPVPPPHLVKQAIVRQYADAYGLRTLVETGTCFGDMVEAMRDHFDRIYSIELSPYLHAKCRRRFRKHGQIELIQGDSAVELPRLVARLAGPALFWLDGHYSAGYTAKGEQETPIIAELTCLLQTACRGHVLLIDDARCFGADPAYPTLEQVTALVRAHRDDLQVEVETDCIRIFPALNRQQP